MYFPADMTADEVMEFEYWLNRQIDIERREGQFWAENAELQVVAEDQRDFYYDELERDCDEQYEPDYADSWYEDQYDLGDY